MNNGNPLIHRDSNHFFIFTVMFLVNVGHVVLFVCFIQTTASLRATRIWQGCQQPQELEVKKSSVKKKKKHKKQEVGGVTTRLVFVFGFWF